MSHTPRGVRSERVLSRQGRHVNTECHQVPRGPAERTAADGFAVDRSPLIPSAADGFAADGSSVDHLRL
jgi:hypothetical protein